MLKRGDKKLINAWAFYDWANSVYSLVIGTAVFPIYYESITDDAPGDLVNFLGWELNPTALYTYALALSFAIVALSSPVLSGIADYTGNKKKFMKFFCYLGGFSVMSMFFFESLDTVWVGIVATIFAGVGFWGSIVFYNSFLPEVALPEQQDAVSAKGFMLGYTGSVLLLVLNLIMIMKPEMLGIPNDEESKNLGAKISFLVVGIWWIGFAQITFSKLENNVFDRKPDKRILLKGYQELSKVFKEIKGLENLKKLLIGFFIYSIGVQTIILLASMYGVELGLGTTDLILTIILVQLVGILGAWVFAKISKKIGNIKTLQLTILVWIIACLGAYSLDKNDPIIVHKFYILGAFLGFALGAIQTISRSTYSKWLPETKDHATYFSFYDVAEKIAIVIGMIISGVVLEQTNSLKNFILILAIFFVIGLLVLMTIKREKNT